MDAARRISTLEGFLLLILGGFAATFFVQSWQFGETAAMFPRLVAGASLALLVLAVAFQIRGEAGARKKQIETMTARPPDAVPWSIALGIQIGYIVLVVLLGFSIATLIYLIGAPLHMRYRRWGVLGAYAVLLTATVVASFTYLFHVRLPEGLLWLSLKSRY